MEDFRTLELHKILEMMSRDASNVKTEKMILEIIPNNDINIVKKEVEKTNDSLKLASKFGTPTFFDFKDVSSSLLRAKSGSNLSFREFLDIAKLLSQVNVLVAWYRQCSDIETALTSLFCGLFANKQLEDKIVNAILSEDEMSDNASAELASIRRKILNGGSKIRDSLDKMVKSSTTQKYLQESIITMRDGRYVLPVKSEYKREIQGLVHDTSSSGSTYFIEPMAVVEANNEIRILKGRELDEIDRIVAELSAECAGMADILMENFDICAELNMYFVKANFGAKMRGTAPEITDNGIIVLKKARHPLIDNKKVVPIDIELGTDFDTLIITGPNTGGKTVILKTVGLLTEMVMCGMLIPVSDGSIISVFKKILVDIGDQQSIEHNLSTFSSHINNIISILKTVDSESLVILDEIGSGTDPIEGAALAEAIIEKLRKSGCRLLVTTHYQELKMYAIKEKGVENASCEFDVTTLMPTFRLNIGSPGKSNAFAISSRLGISDEVINHAKILVTTENQRFEEVVAELEAARNKLLLQNEEISILKNGIAVKSHELQVKLDNFDQSKDAEFEKARIQAMRIVEGVRLQSGELLDELSAIRKMKEKEQFSSLAVGAKSQVKSALDKMYNDANPVKSGGNDSYKLPRPLKQGDSVLIFDINKKGILASNPDNNGNVFVQAGIMKTKVNISKLRLIEAEKVTFKSKKVSTSGVKSKMERQASMELDIRGENVDEGLHELASFLDNCVMSGMGIVTIIHGKGTGILRKAVHRYLKNHPSVKNYRLGVYGEGEDGVTIVELK